MGHLQWTLICYSSSKSPAQIASRGHIFTRGASSKNIYLRCLISEHCHVRIPSPLLLLFLSLRVLSFTTYSSIHASIALSFSLTHHLFLIVSLYIIACFFLSLFLSHFQLLPIRLSFLFISPSQSLLLSVCFSLFFCH